MQAGEVVTDIYFDFGKVPVGFQSTANPTLSVMVNGNAVTGYYMVNRADVGGRYQGTWQTATASWVTIIRNLTPVRPSHFRKRDSDKRVAAAFCCRHSRLKRVQAEETVLMRIVVKTR